MASRKLAILLSVSFCAVATARAQEVYSTADLSQRVIVSWRHFGQTPPASASQPVPQARVFVSGPGVIQSNDPPQSSAGPAVSSTAQGAPSVVPSGARIYEADIGKKHPHPPELLKLPPGQDGDGAAESAPAVDQVVVAPSDQRSSGNQPQSSGPQPPPPSENSAEAQIALLESAYKNREAERAAQLSELQAAVATHPAEQSAIQIEETRLEVQSQQDRASTYEELSKSYAVLAGNLDASAENIRRLADQRKQTASVSDAQVSQISPLVPRRQVALDNLSMLPASSQNAQTIKGLNAELNQNRTTIQLDQARSQQALQEARGLEAESERLGQAAAEARDRSAAFVTASQNAQAAQERLEDRLQYSKAQLKAENLLQSASQVLGKPAPSANAVQAVPAPSGASPAAKLNESQR
jgi:hypothetical protein